MITHSLSNHSLLLIAGASGLGRTTFINTLCDADVVPKRECDEPEMAHIEEGIKIKPYTVGMLSQSLVVLVIILQRRGANSWGCILYFIAFSLPELDEDGVKISLTVVDTPGFGDMIDNEYW